jgi:hypothetical protein
MSKNVPIKELRAMKEGECRRAFLVPHRADRNVHVTAARIGMRVSTQRAWVVPQSGSPEECVIVWRLYEEQ